MGLDIRIPLGVMFGLIGLLLAGFGLVSDPALYQRSLGININLWWGLALMVFGAVMLLLAWRKAADGRKARSAGGGNPSGHLQPGAR
jgi:membrane protein implicated in regulation of membrane protease activity